MLHLRASTAARDRVAVLCAWLSGERRWLQCSAAARHYSNPYAVLGLSHGATSTEIKAAFLRLAKKWHPDLNPGDPNAGKRFADINAAYKELSDPQSKARVDYRYSPPSSSSSSSYNGGRWQDDWQRPPYQAWEGFRPKREPWARANWRDDVRYHNVYADRPPSYSRAQEKRTAAVIAVCVFLVAIQFLTGVYRQGTRNIIERRSQWDRSQAKGGEHTGDRRHVDVDQQAIDPLWQPWHLKPSPSSSSSSSNGA